MMKGAVTTTICNMTNHHPLHAPTTLHNIGTNITILAALASNTHYYSHWVTAFTPQFAILRICITVFILYMECGPRREDVIKEVRVG